MLSTVADKDPFGMLAEVGKRVERAPVVQVEPPKSRRRAKAAPEPVALAPRADGPTLIELVLPYPVSSNKYWRPVHIGNHITIVPTKEAKAYKAEVGWRAKAAGVRAPIVGRVAIEVKLYPHRPLDWVKRARLDPNGWADTVQCIDLDNANKVLLDALKGVAIEDDRWVRRITAERMEPDGEPARLIVTVRALQPEIVQAGLL